ncbi:MAG TPA: dTDP-4-dehydrorhamnose reductase [Stellaceae bacterium]|jgi:dTDP-4-dehydrorhamnose reductase|nr:dTDP-4-dehydrorhamnose reductase [Stellaceae bacterium]
MSADAGKASLRPVVVFGAGGQIGRAVLLRGGALPAPLIGYTRAEADLRDLARLRAVLRATAPGIVINAAGYTAVDRAESEPELAFAVNRDGADNLAVACAEIGAPLIHISTNYVFDGRQPSAYSEHDRAAPVNVYGASERAGEERVRERLPRHVILRTSWVYGAHGTNFATTILRLARERDELRVVDDQIGCPTPAAAIADALLAIAGQIAGGAERWGIYHFCGAPVTSWCGFAGAIVAAAAAHLPRVPRVVPISTAQYQTAATRPASSALDCTKIATGFGLRQPDWRATLPAIVAEICRGA